MRESKIYENNLYNCDIRSAENLEKIYDARRDWVNGSYNYNWNSRNYYCIERLKYMADLLKKLLPFQSEFSHRYACWANNHNG